MDPVWQLTGLLASSAALGYGVLRLLDAKAKAPAKVITTAAELRKERAKPVLDPTKRKSLQPGAHPIPKGFREVAGSNEIVAAAQHPDNRVIPGSVMAPKPQPSPITNDTASREALAKLEGVSFQHRFYGSQLIVGETVVVRGLSPTLHNMEITPKGQLFVDNLPHTINPGDLVRVKTELAKLRQ